MAQLSARGIALAALTIWRTQHQRADLVITKLLSETKLGAADRAFALELFYGVLRNLLLLDFWIACLRPARVDSDLREILRLGLYQLLLLGTSDHAAVYESVELAPLKRRAFINGVLRAAARDRDELRSRTNAQPLSIRKSHPDFLISRWQKNFGPESAAALCAWNNQPPPVYGRINRLKIDYEQFMHRYPDARPSRHSPAFVEFFGFPTEALNRGHCYIQDPSTTIACQLLDPQSGEKILDACSAPGGKTSRLAEQMENRGHIVACDREAKRIQTLKENITRLGIGIVRELRHDWTHDRIPKEIRSIAPFDRALVDTPCTNTGVMRRRIDVRWRLRPIDFMRMKKQQLEIVRTVSCLLKPGGTLVYSTCSVEPEENGQVVQQLLAEFPGMRLIEEKSSLPFRNDLDGAYAAKLVTASRAG